MCGKKGIPGSRMMRNCLSHRFMLREAPDPRPNRLRDGIWSRKTAKSGSKKTYTATTLRSRKCWPPAIRFRADSHQSESLALTVERNQSLNACCAYRKHRSACNGDVVLRELPPILWCRPRPRGHLRHRHKTILCWIAPTATASTLQARISKPHRLGECYGGIPIELPWDEPLIPEELSVLGNLCVANCWFGRSRWRSGGLLTVERALKSAPKWNCCSNCSATCWWPSRGLPVPAVFARWWLSRSRSSINCSSWNARSNGPQIWPRGIGWCLASGRFCCHRSAYVKSRWSWRLRRCCAFTRLW